MCGPKYSPMSKEINLNIHRIYYLQIKLQTKQWAIQTISNVKHLSFSGWFVVFGRNLVRNLVRNLGHLSCQMKPGSQDNLSNNNRLITVRSYTPGNNIKKYSLMPVAMIRTPLQHTFNPPIYC